MGIELGYTWNSHGKKWNVIPINVASTLGFIGIYRDLCEYHWDILGIIVENITGIKNLPLFAHTWGNPHTK
jgi:hypothetical protein